MSTAPTLQEPVNRPTDGGEGDPGGRSAMSSGRVEDAAFASTVLLHAAPAASALATTVAQAGAVPSAAREAQPEGRLTASVPASSSLSRARPPPSAGARVGHYELLRELGRGGMGTVFLARDLRLARLVAVKLLTSLNSTGVQRFLIEAQATARCKHEHIVTIHEVNEHDGYPYMVLEYIEGQSLRAWMKQRKSPESDEDLAMAPVPPSLAVDLMVPVVRALSRAHASGIVHRDLKPENIMLEASGAIKVVDFGIAKLREDEVSLALAAERPVAGDTGLTRDGAVMGTLPYMSPEQWRGREIDQSTDIWAVGIMLHELVLGAHPLAPVSMNNLLCVALPDEPMPEVSARHPELGAIGAIIDRCLRKQKSERFASAEELLAALLPRSRRRNASCSRPGDDRRTPRSSGCGTAARWSCRRRCRNRMSLRSSCRRCHCHIPRRSGNRSCTRRRPRRCRHRTGGPRGPRRKALLTGGPPGVRGAGRRREAVRGGVEAVRGGVEAVRGGVEAVRGGAGAVRAPPPRLSAAAPRTAPSPRPPRPSSTCRPRRPSRSAPAT
ncbi:hypothetical protein BE11_18420 [Sorangium cellulosum]|nr:hypothetical protein BE11_18420 [Sorangium cellulosum]